MLVSIFVSMETVCIERCPQHGSIASDCIKFGVFGTTVKLMSVIEMNAVFVKRGSTVNFLSFTAKIA